MNFNKVKTLHILQSRLACQQKPVYLFRPHTKYTNEKKRIHCRKDLMYQIGNWKGNKTSNCVVKRERKQFSLLYFFYFRGIELCESSPEYWPLLFQGTFSHTLLKYPIYSPFHSHATVWRRLKRTVLVFPVYLAITIFDRSSE